MKEVPNRFKLNFEYIQPKQQQTLIVHNKQTQTVLNFGNRKNRCLLEGGVDKNEEERRRITSVVGQKSYTCIDVYPSLHINDRVIE